MEIVWIEFDTHCLHSPSVRFCACATRGYSYFTFESTNGMYVNNVESGIPFAIKIIPSISQYTMAQHAYKIRTALINGSLMGWHYLGFEVDCDWQNCHNKFDIWGNAFDIFMAYASIYSYDFGICNLRLILIRKSVGANIIIFELMSIEAIDGA